MLIDKDDSNDLFRVRNLHKSLIAVLEKLCSPDFNLNFLNMSIFSHIILNHLLKEGCSHVKGDTLWHGFDDFPHFLGEMLGFQDILPLDLCDVPSLGVNVVLDRKEFV